LAITGAGVPFGATMPNQVTNSYPGSPASADVGYCGADLRRSDCATARIFRRPASTGARTAPRPTKVSWTWPPTVSFTAGPAPRYGTCRISTPAAALNISPARCGAVPLPDDP